MSSGSAIENRYFLLDAELRVGYNDCQFFERTGVVAGSPEHYSGQATRCTDGGVVSHRALPKEALARDFPKRGCFYQTNPTEKSTCVST